jgi:hypothetical protein
LCVTVCYPLAALLKLTAFCCCCSTFRWLVHGSLLPCSLIYAHENYRHEIPCALADRCHVRTLTVISTSNHSRRFANYRQSCCGSVCTYTAGDITTVPSSTTFKLVCNYKGTPTPSLHHFSDHELGKNSFLLVRQLECVKRYGEDGNERVFL